jgi:hypothetical protein
VEQGAPGLPDGLVEQHVVEVEVVGEAAEEAVEVGGSEGGFDGEALGDELEFGLVFLLCLGIFIQASCGLMGD